MTNQTHPEPLRLIVGREVLHPASRRRVGSTYGALLDDMRAHLDGREPLVIKRIALNMDQVEEYGPPPNPAKSSDSRIGQYLELYGDESWELDALPPNVLDDLIAGEIEALILPDVWAEDAAREKRERELLGQAVAEASGPDYRFSGGWE